MISDKRPVQDLIAILKEHNVQHIVISPGSRNAPLSISFESDPYFECYSIVDERSAAFFALGIAQQTGQTTAIVCTSGSAALNYAPAITEAYYQQIPLLVITADRPAEWIGQGDGQTIQQNGVFGNHVLFNAQLSPDSIQEDSSWYNARLINEALILAQAEVKGPVHLNIPFKEPLYGLTEKRSENPKIIQRAKTGSMLSPDALKEVSSTINNSGKILVICGLMRPDPELQLLLAEFALNENVQVLTESTSNLNHENFVSSIDRLIMTFDETEEKRFKPDLLITLGIQIISKKIKALLRKNKPLHHWHIGYGHGILDTFQSLNMQIQLNPVTFFTQIAQIAESQNSEYGRWLKARDQQNEKNQNKFLKKLEFSDFKVFNEIVKRIPAKSNLQMGNSSVVRYFQLFKSSSSLSYNGNRGTSGIDGCTSTAMGAAWVNNKVTTLVSGDLSFLYDSNALWMNYVKKKLRIIVINNGGGGIFKIIDGPSTTPYSEKHFEAKHKHDLKQLAAHAKIRYRTASDDESVKTSLDWLYRGQKCSILEIFTPSEKNDKVLKQYFKFLKDNK